MPAHTPDSTSNRLPPLAPISTPPRSSKKRGREDLSPSGASLDENGDTQMHLPPSRTPAISPVRSQVLPSINPWTGQPTSVEEQRGISLEAALEKSMNEKTEETEIPDEDTESQTPKRMRVHREESSNIIDFAKGTPPAEPLNPGFHTPEIDKYTHLLGVGWAKLGEDPDVLAAARGFCLYINNRYPLTKPEILLESKGLESYLVKSDQGYFLFKEHLNEARLVATGHGSTMARLQSPPINFEGEKPIFAATASKLVPLDADGK